MRDTNNLTMRYLTWSCVKEIPRPLRAVMGKKRLVRSLGTHDLKVAQAKRYAVLAEFERDIAAARRMAAPSNAVTVGLEMRATLAKIDEGDDATIRSLWGYGGGGYTGDETPQQVARIYADEAIWTMTDHLRETEGDAAAEAFSAITDGSATPLLHHLETWLAEGGTKGPFRERTKLQARTDVKRLATWAKSKGVPETVEAFTRKAVGRYVSDTIVAPGIDPGTGNRWVSAASSYWRWMIKRAGIELNPWTGQGLAKTASHRTNDDKHKRPFTTAEMCALLAGDPGQELADLIRIAALSGMRREEIYRLTVMDCAGDWFNVRMSKTRAGRRRVPIHPEIADIIARRCVGKAPKDFLLHEAGPVAEDRGDAAGKRFIRYRQAQGVHERADGARHSVIDFHSLRRWFVTTARNAGIDRAVVAGVVGHEVGNITDDTYSSGPSDELRRACVLAVRLPTVSPLGAAAPS